MHRDFPIGWFGMVQDFYSSYLTLFFYKHLLLVRLSNLKKKEVGSTEGIYQWKLSTSDSEINYFKTLGTNG